MTEAELKEWEIRQRVAMVVAEGCGPSSRTVREVLAVIPKAAAIIRQLQADKVNLLIALGQSEARA